MFEKLQRSRLLYWTIELLAVALLIFVSTQIDFIFMPIGAFFSTLFSPVLISGFLFYMLNPIVALMERKLKINRTIGIIIVFVLVIGLVSFGIINLIPSLIHQMSDLAKNVPGMAKDFKNWVLSLQNYRMFENVDIQGFVSKVDLKWGDIIKNTLNTMANSLGSVFGVVTQAIVLIATVPFVLFYMLKDGDKIGPFIVKFFKADSQDNVQDLLFDMNNTIAKYISGQVIQCLLVFAMTFIGYLFIGVPYAFLFGLIAGLCNLIPYVGPFFGLTPAFLATIFDSPIRAVLIIVLTMVVQQIVGSFIYPNLIGKSLAIHPVMIVFILLVGGNLAGLTGIFLVVPFYAICKIVVKFFITMYREKNGKILPKQSEKS